MVVSRRNAGWTGCRSDIVVTLGWVMRMRIVEVEVLFACLALGTPCSTDKGVELRAHVIRGLAPTA